VTVNRVKVALLRKVEVLKHGLGDGIEINAAAHFWGYTDEWPDAEVTSSVERARGVLAVGVVQLAIEKARNRGRPAK